MYKTYFVILAVLFCSVISFAGGHRCGTNMLIQFNRDLQSTPSRAISARTAISDAIETDCEADDYYDTVYTRTSNHFQIFYTKSGPHKTTEEFIDSLISFAESAFKFHTQKLGMLAPTGQTTTIHYQQDVISGLYPIEVIDIDNLRNSRPILGGICHGCFGVTVPHKTEVGASELLMDNDFRYTPEVGIGTPIKKDSVNFNGKNCKYNVATEELKNEIHSYSYASQWDKALRITTIHELYHAVQVRYLDLYKHSNFWFEASASGMEEIAEPDIDDYYSYLPQMFQLMGTPLNKADLVESAYLYTNVTYGSGIFLLYLHKFVDKNIDKSIWEGFAKNPNDNFEKQLDAYTKNKNLSADSVFHDFATRLAFSGNKTSFLDTAQWITNDQYFWPEFSYYVNNPSFSVNNDSSNYFYPKTEKLAYKYYMNGEPDLSDYTGKASYVLFKGKSANVSEVPSVYSVSQIFAEASADPSVDSIAWVFSRFNTGNLYPIDVKTVPMHAYPIPWREGNLCFTPLPENKNFIEIRNRRGDLVNRMKYSGRTLCIDETTVRDMMVPGVYRFRAGSSGKTKDFLIIY